jgi:hypothetical protein
MTTSKRKRNIRERVQNYRDRLRAQGLRPVQLWVPDTRSAKFRAAAHRQALAVAKSPRETDNQAFVDSVSILNDE